MSEVQSDVRHERSASLGRALTECKVRAGRLGSASVARISRICKCNFRLFKYHFAGKVKLE